MTLEWILLEQNSTITTHATNVPGGVLVHAWTSIVFIPGVKLVVSSEKYSLESTMTEDLSKVMEPFRELTEMFGKIEGAPIPKDPE